VEQTEESKSSKDKIQNKEEKGVLKVVHLADLIKQDFDRVSTGISEFDRVLGGGIVKGSLVLIAGDPGIGKSTLLTQLALNIQHKVKRTTVPSTLHANPCLYVAGEESAQQIKMRVERIKKGADLAVLNETDVDVITGVMKELKPSLVVVDSIQTLETEDLNGIAGSIGQVRESAHRLQRAAKTLHIPVFIIGHVTKEGTVAGPKTLEHLVDVVLSLEGDPQSFFRILRTNKNRFGSTDEVGIFEMVEAGMIEVINPSRLFLETKVDEPGSAVVVTLNGLRPLVVEIQALVTRSFSPLPRRTGTGIDNNRLQLLAAVLTKRLGLPLGDKDIFINVTGGLKIFEPAVDLGICLAIVSSLKEKVISSKTVLLGEVGLLGELRTVRQLNKRITEAKKLGFTKVISPENARSLPEAVCLALESSQ